MSDPSASSWPYWRDKKGIIEALDYYPNAVAANPVLQVAIHNIRANEALIDKIMGELPGEDD